MKLIDLHEARNYKKVIIGFKPFEPCTHSWCSRTKPKFGPPLKADAKQQGYCIYLYLENNNRMDLHSLHDRPEELVKGNDKGEIRVFVSHIIDQVKGKNLDRKFPNTEQGYKDARAFADKLAKTFCRYERDWSEE
jgi:hypothetical protein